MFLLLSDSNLDIESGRNIMLVKLNNAGMIKAHLKQSIKSLIDTKRYSEIVIIDKSLVDILLLIILKILGKKAILILNDSRKGQLVNINEINLLISRPQNNNKLKILLAHYRDIVRIYWSYTTIVQTSREKDYFPRNLHDKIKVINNGVEYEYKSVLRTSEILVLTSTSGFRKYEFDIFRSQLYDEELVYDILSSPIDGLPENINFKSYNPDFAQCLAGYEKVIIPSYHRSGFINRLYQSLASGCVVMTSKRVIETLPEKIYLECQDRLFDFSQKTEFKNLKYNLFKPTNIEDWNKVLADYKEL